MSPLVRRAIAVLVSAVCGPLALPAVQSASAAATATPKVVKVMPLGDSITLGIGSSTDAGYRLPLWRMTTTQSRYTVQFVGSQHDGDFPQPWHEGHGGWKIDDIAAHIDGWLAAQSPDVVLLHIGINDLDSGTDKEHAPDRLAALVDRIFTDRPGVDLILQGLLPTTQGLQDQIQQYNLRAENLAPAEEDAGRHFHYIEAPQLTPNEFHDRLHPNDLGYTRMADAYFQALNADVGNAQLPLKACP
ncbi:SGNH/GDSL hydrolase family protein [Kitasatospora acidiphila]|uniref:SGNH/GDSL hydrolase family protein n=1 Tax=Kitasatospora acidiphila TaxID=2567942 RepID=UPI003C7440B6